ncbi:branched-chain amino acid transport system II carrier protein [Vibrio rarus]|uniref:branched-chain amino acid transport system II carrier protein n=1 Tax=Vibrio rarus TaxID=413403 RepID=UPI0021C29A4F|nr:branched-chain amino acid transport system II carrier protein [Vibrio rarus]
MKNTLSTTDIIALGFMLFAFFLGAGNIIFPPMAGQLAGENLLPAMGGFLLTAAGLPLITVVAVATAGGTWEHLTSELPKKVAFVIAALIFIIIGPAFAAPRAGLVAYEMGVRPFLSQPNAMYLALFSLCFFVLAMALAWTQGSLLDTIGKILTPIMFLGLVLLSIAVVINPQGPIIHAQGDYMSQPFTKGILEGYLTMDTFASLMFGMLLVQAIHSKGVTERADVARYLIVAGVIAAVGLCLVYIALFYLGATSNSIAAGLENGGAILAEYVKALFGEQGQWVLSGIVLLACLTTAVGLISASSDFFSRHSKLDYKFWVVVNGSVCAFVANIGLAQLIELSIPVLFALYPIAIALVALTFVRQWLPKPQLAYRMVLSIAFLCALLDAAKVIGWDVSVFQFIPLFELGLGWVLPTVIAIVTMMFVGERNIALYQG